MFFSPGGSSNRSGTDTKGARAVGTGHQWIEIVPAGDFVSCTVNLCCRIAAESEFRKEIHEKLYERS